MVHSVSTVRDRISDLLEEKKWNGSCSGGPRNVFGGGGSTNSVEDRENSDLGGGSPLVRGSGGSCNLVQGISFHIIKFS